MDSLRGKRIAIPGKYTTAHLLLMLYGAGYEDVSVMPFEQVMPAVERGEADAGLIIHEGRFTYKLHGLRRVLDLGEWWEKDTGLPIPLGCIIAKRSLGADTVAAVEAGIRASIQYAYSHRDETRSYIKSNAQEMDDSVIDSHIGLYVNDFSLDLGDEGVTAISELFRRAAARGIVPDTRASLFL